MQQQNILITGASGFVGRSLHTAFLKQFDTVLGIGRRSYEQLDHSVPRSNYCSFDLMRPFEECPVFKNQSCFNVVIHAAALSSPWGSRKTFFANNVETTRRLLDYCHSNGLPRFIFISSPSIFYRPGDQFNMTESTPQAAKPVNHYAESKQIAERLVR